jgi:hypothetical protein
VENHESFTDFIEKITIIDTPKANRIQDSLIVLNWYSSIIGAKIHRAMSQSDFGVEDNSDMDLQDQLGSAKVALISIDKSIEALSYILNITSDYEIQSLSFLAMLSKIKRLLLFEFPTAMDFIRPGFDD